MPIHGDVPAAVILSDACQFAAVAAEQRAYLLAFELDVLIVVDRGAEFDGLQKRSIDPVLTLEVDPRLLEVDANDFFFLFFLDGWNRPFFLFAHYFAPHAPYTVSDDSLRTIQTLADELGIAATGGSDAHKSGNVGTTRTLVRKTGTVEESLRAALAERDTRWQGHVYSWRSQVGMFSQQTHKNIAALGAEVKGKIRRNGTGRDLGYPGGKARPVAFDRIAAGLPPEDGA